MENNLLSAISHKEVALRFAEWIQSEKYWKTVERVGGKWFKIGVGGNYTTSDIFDIFLKEVEEDISAAELTAYYSQLEEAGKNFGGV